MAEYDPELITKLAEQYGAEEDVVRAALEMQDAEASMPRNLNFKRESGLRAVIGDTGSEDDTAALNEDQVASSGRFSLADLANGGGSRPSRSGGGRSMSLGDFADYMGYQGESAPESPAKKRDSGLWDTVVSGTKGTLRAIGATADLHQGDRAELLQAGEDATAAQSTQDERLAKLKQRIAEEKKRLGEDAGWWDTAKALGSAAWDNPAGAGLLLAEQLPNSAAAMGGGWAGLKAGALVGGTVGPVGATVGGIAGGVIGMFGANYALEGGNKAIEAAQEGKLTDADLSRIKEEGATKAGVITGVDVATLGLTGKLFGATQRAVDRAGVRVLAEAGVDATDRAAVTAAVRANPALIEAVQAAERGAYEAATTLGQRAIRGGAAVSLETLSEGVGEYWGEGVATGKWDKMEAMIEAFSSLGQSTGEAAWVAARNKVDPVSSILSAQDVNAAIESAKAAVSADDLALGKAGDDLYQAATNVQDDAAQARDAAATAALSADLKLQGSQRQVEIDATMDQQRRAENIDPLINAAETTPGFTQPSFKTGTGGLANDVPIIGQEQKTGSANLIIPGRETEVDAFVVAQQKQSRGEALSSYEAALLRNPPVTTSSIVTPDTIEKRSGGQAAIEAEKMRLDAMRRSQPALDAEAAQQELNPAPVTTQANPVTPIPLRDVQSGAKPMTQQTIEAQENQPLGKVPTHVGGQNADLLSNEQLQAIIQNKETHHNTRRAAQAVLGARFSQYRMPSEQILTEEETSTQPAAQPEPQQTQSFETTNHPDAIDLKKMFVQSGFDAEVKLENTNVLMGKSRISTGTAKVLNGLAKMLGKKVVYFSASKQVPGAAVKNNENDNRVWINVDDPMSPLRLLGHETLHKLKQQSPKAYATLRSAMAGLMTDDVLAKEWRNYFGEEKNKTDADGNVIRKGRGDMTDAEISAALRDNATREMIIEEMLGDLSGNRFAEPEFWTQVFEKIEQKEGREKAKGLIAKLKEAVLLAINKIQSMLRGEKFAADGFLDEIEHLDGVRKALSTAYAQYISDVRDGKVADENDTVSEGGASYASPNAAFKNQTLPTRWPTSKKLDPAPTVNDPMITDLDTLKLDQTQYEKAVNAILEEPGMHSADIMRGTLDEKAEHVIERMKANLLWLYDQVPDIIRERSKLWYDGARKIAEAWADRYDVSESQAAGMLAVLSPQKDWFMNVTMAERVLDIIHTKMSHTFDAKMDAAAFGFLTKESLKDDPDSKKNLNAYEAVKGKTLAEVARHHDLRQMSIWIRAYDEAYHDAKHAIVTPEGGFVEDKTTMKGEPTLRAWGDFTTPGKAASIYLNGTPENINRMLGGEHKVRNFYNNIFAPRDSRFTTIDTHAVAADMLRALAGADKPVAENFGKTGGTNITGLSGTYALHYEAYRRAAEERDVLPREMQSITWEAVRGLFTEGFKGKKDNVAAIDAVWNDVDAGKITARQARNRILNIAGGINNPDWYSEGNAEYKAVLRDKTYKQERGAFHGAKVTFEVAPDPRNTALKARWDALPQQVKNEISHKVAWKIAAKALASFGDENMKGELHGQLGGWLDDTNPSLSIWFNKRAAASKINDFARMLGFALNQMGMMRTSQRPFRGVDGKTVPQSGAVLIDLTADTDVNLLYQKIRGIVDSKGKPYVFGHTTSTEQMVIINDEKKISTQELAKKIADVVGDEYEVGHNHIYVEFLEKGRNSYGLRGQKAVSSESSLRARSDQLRAESGVLLDQLIGEHESKGKFSTRRPDAAGDERTGAGDVGTGQEVQYGQTRQGVRPLKAVHYSGAERSVLDARMYGTGAKGAEAARVASAKDARLKKRVYFYVDRGNGIRPEQGVGSVAHGVTLNNVYDADGISIQKTVDQSLQGNDWLNAFESAVLDAGYDGYVTDFGNQRAVVLMGEHQVPVVAAKPEAKFSTPRQVADAWSELAQEDGTFQYSIKPGNTLQAIIKEFNDDHTAGMSVKGIGAGEYRKKGVTQRWEITIPKSNPAILFEDNKGQVWLDASALQSGVSRGSMLYAIAGNYAYNTGKVFIGDPGGLSDYAVFRRTEHMLSLALKYKTTRHIGPGTRQTDPSHNADLQDAFNHTQPGDMTDGFQNKSLQDWVDPLTWEEGNDGQNLENLIKTSYANTVKLAPEIRDVKYNRDTKRFEDRSGKAVVLKNLAGTVASLAPSRGFGHLGSVEESGDAGLPNRRYIVGSATLQRGAITKAILDGSVGGNLGEVVRELRGSGVTKKALYSTFRPVDTSSKEFKRWFGDSKVVDADGKPLVVYHGGPKRISTFNMNGGKAYFYPDEDSAWDYADRVSGRVYETYLSIKNPAYLDPYDTIDSRLTADKVKELQDKGYDGVIARDDVNGDVTEYIAFYPSQIKSATSNTGEFSDTNPDIHYSLPRQQPWYYSALEDGIKSMPAKVSGTPATNVALWLKSNAEKLKIKKDELEWSGVMDYLAMLGKQKITADDLADWVAKNGVKVEETVLTNGEPVWFVRDNVTGKVLKSGFNSDFDAEDWADENGHDDVTIVQNDEPSGSAKFHDYVLPGGENYKELLITLPVEVEKQGAGKYIARSNGVAAFGETEAAALNNANAFRSSHFDQPNILAHIRLNERTDADGKRVLFIEEIQSDWGQKGKKEGFDKERKTKPLEPGEYEAFIKRMRLAAGEVFRSRAGGKIDDDVVESLTNTLPLADLATTAGMQDEYADITLRQNEDFDILRGRNTSVPSAPFVTDTKSWTSLALKRAIAYAVDNGFDSIAWTTGEQQSSRYDLSKQIDSIDAGMSGRDGKYLITLNKRGSIVQELRLEKGEIEDYVGKDLAEKITRDVTDEDTNASYSGLDLKVGGEGMKGFYDQIVGQVAKKLGAQVGVVDLSEDAPTFRIEGSAQQFKSEGARAGVQPGFTITDQMREQASGKGMPLFSTRRSAITGQPINQVWQNTAPPSAWDEFVRKMQDKLIDTKRILAEIRKAGVAIKETLDPYLQETLYHGRAAKRVSEFAESELKPLLVEMHARGIEMQEIEDYLWARHAAERNAQVAKVNQNMPDGGSGLTNKQAADILAGQKVTINGRDIQIRPAKMAAYQSIAARVKKITEGTLDTLVAYGLESQDTVDTWKKTYQNYIPLMRDMESDDNYMGAFGLGMGTGQGFSVRGSASKRALGSERGVIDILANLAMQRERAITRGEKNRVAQSVYGLAISAPNTEFWVPVNPDAKDPAKLRQLVQELIDMGLNPIDAQNIANEPKQRYIDPRTGLVAERINPQLRGRQDVLSVRVNGKDRFVMFSSDERAQHMVRNLKNLDNEELGLIMQNMAVVTRWFASVNTQYNPVFGLTNGIRDLGAGALNLSSTALKNDKAAVLKGAFAALRGIYSDLRDHRAGRTPTSQWAQLFEEFQREGGQTGYRDMFQTSKARTDALAKELKDAGKGNRWLAFGEKSHIFGWLSDYNTSIENAVRLSAYKVAKDKGMSNQQAAALAKNLTVNFNKKGLAATQAGAMYAFFNAAVQGTARIGETMVKDGKLSPAGQKILYGGMMLGVMQAVMFALAGYDDEEPPQHIREKNLVIPGPDGKYVSIPMPLGFHVIPNIGRIATEFALSGFKNPGKRMTQLAGLFMDSFNPLGGTGGSVTQMLSPTITDPIVALNENRDWTGKNIYKEDFNKMKPTAGWTRTKDTASDFSKAMSYGINYITGGGKYEIGILSPTPDQIDYLIGQATGGVGRETLKLWQAGKTPISGEELPMYKIPVAGRFIGETTGQSSESSKFYANLKRIGEHHSVLDEMKDAKDGDARLRYLAKHPDARMVQMADKASREVAYLKRKKRDALEKGDSERVKLLEMQITNKIKQWNARLSEKE